MPQTKHRTSRRETFNQIVLMLIVAFSLRVFVVEAFVIPTGSMAPTLKGAHSRFTCDNCGHNFDVNYSSGAQTSGEMVIPRYYASGNPRDIHCANCGYRLPSVQTVTPRIYYGDRILVLKYAYLFSDPARWDVVVFKSPATPEVHNYSQAYIKRLVGTPGEKVMILDGDIYATRAANPTDESWTIQRKPAVVQDALWRIVHDASHTPRGLAPDSGSTRETYSIESYQPWRASDESWRYTRDETGARAFNFSNLTGQSTLRFDRNVARQKHALTDWLAYDQIPGQGSLHAVSDLKLSLFYTRHGGDGPLHLNLSKRGDLFTAEITPSAVSLYLAHVDAPNDRRQLASAEYSLPSRPVRIEFINVDYQVRLLIDGVELLTTTPEQYAPNISALRDEFRDGLTQYISGPYPTISVDATSQVCSLAHLELWRDVHYTNRRANGAPLERGDPDQPVTLGPDEYFVLGDNSPHSEDGRAWRDPVNLPAEDVDAQAGVVPGRFMLGKAFFVYWPAGYRLYHRNAPDLIPNFGEIRFIH